MQVGGDDTAWWSCDSGRHVGEQPTEPSRKQVDKLESRATVAKHDKHRSITSLMRYLVNTRVQLGCRSSKLVLVVWQCRDTFTQTKAMRCITLQCNCLFDLIYTIYLFILY